VREKEGQGQEKKVSDPFSANIMKNKKHYTDLNSASFASRERERERVKSLDTNRVSEASPRTLVEKKVGVWGDVQIILKHPQFRPLRHLLTLWVVFTLVAGGYWAYTLMSADVSDAAVAVDDTQSEFDAGAYSYTQWDGANSWVEGTNITPNPLWELPDNAATTGWQDMTGNVLLMHMNEASGTISDTSGQGNDGTQNGGVTYNATGKLNTAMSFDGVDDYVAIPDTDQFAWGTGNFAYSVWVKTSDTSSNYKGIINAYSVTSNNQHMQYQPSTDTLIFGWGGSSFQSETVNLNDGQWHHLVFQRTGSTNSEIYVDGFLIGTKNNNPSGNIVQPVDLWIGAINIAGRYWLGEIDEVAIFNRALSATEIANIYEKQSPLYTGTFTSDIKDVGDSTYNSIAWAPQRPTGKELPDNAVSETAYNTGNANMTGNVLLVHMNEASGIIADTSGQGSTLKQQQIQHLLEVIR